MAETPPTRFAAYPRPALSSYGSPERFRALAHGFNGLTNLSGIAFFANFAYVLPWVMGRPVMLVIALLLGDVVAMTWLVTRTGPLVWKIGFGLGWSPRKTAAVRVFFSVGIFCSAIIAFIILTNKAVREITKYGVKPAFDGIKLPEINATLARLRAAEVSPSPPHSAKPAVQNP